MEHTNGKNTLISGLGAGDEPFRLPSMEKTQSALPYTANTVWLLSKKQPFTQPPSAQFSPTWKWTRQLRRPDPPSGALGTQGEKLVAEYKSRTGELHAVVFNKTNRKFVAGRFDIADPSANTKIYSIKDSGNTGTALFFALIPLAMEDQEFDEQYRRLADCKKAGFPDMKEADEAAYILCDNLYRRIENAENLGNDGLKIIIPSTGNVQQISPLNLARGTYSPTSVLFGTFHIFHPGMSRSSAASIDKNSFAGKYSLSKRIFSPKEQLLIPSLADWYIIPPEVDSICKHAQMTTTGTQPMRNFFCADLPERVKPKQQRQSPLAWGFPICSTPALPTPRSLISWGRCCRIPRRPFPRQMNSLPDGYSDGSLQRLL